MINQSAFAAVYMARLIAPENPRNDVRDPWSKLFSHPSLYRLEDRLCLPSRYILATVTVARTAT
jgi:hypothetical protein